MKVGFLEETEGVHSSTRLLAFILVALVSGLVAVTCIYVLHTSKPEASVIAALTGMVAVLVAQGMVAIVKRSADPDVVTIVKRSGTDA